MSRRPTSQFPSQAPQSHDGREDAAQPVHPPRIFGVLALTAGLLLAFVLAFPSGRLQLTESLALNFISVEQLKGGGGPQYADIGHILAAHSQEVGGESQDPAPGDGDGRTAEREIERPRPSRVAGKGADEIAQILRQIENPLALRPFFRTLSERSASEVVRVVHYGDSQIEGDRISDFLRQRYQERYGGCGVGLVPLYDPMPVRVSVMQESEGDWRHYVPFGRLDKSIPHDRFGIMGAIYRYQPYPPPEPEAGESGLDDEDVRVTSGSAAVPHLPERRSSPPQQPVESAKARDSSPPGDPPSEPVESDAAAEEDDRRGPAIESEASVTVKRSRLALPTARRFQVIRLLTGHLAQPVDMLWQRGDEIERQRLQASGEFRVYERDFGEAIPSLSLHFLSGPSPDLYGIALDCPSGVAVDNIPLRGASGIFVHRWNQQAIRRQMEEMHVGLVIWQFGVNVVPYLEDNYDFYRRNLKRSLERLGEAYPQASILVIGISDMSHKDEAGYYRTRSNVEGIRDAQREAALASGAAFWDLHEAMGGRNSMPSWVKENLATPDYTHFSPKGARIVARMLYNALRASQEKVFPEETPHDTDPTASGKSRSAD